MPDTLDPLGVDCPARLAAGARRPCDSPVAADVHRKSLAELIIGELAIQTHARVDHGAVKRGHTNPDSGGRSRPRGRGRPVLLFAFLHDDQCQPTYATRCWASASAAVLACVGSVRTVAFCPSQSRVSKTISPSG